MPCAIAFGLAVAAPASAARAPLVLRAPSHVRSGHRFAISGTVTGVPAGTPVRLLARPYTARAARLLATVSTDAAGGFRYTTTADRTTRYTAQPADAGGARASAVVGVLGRTDMDTRPLPLGRTRITVLVFHPRDLRWNGVRAWWRLDSGAQSWHAVTTSKRLSRYVTMLQLTATLPAGRFRWRVCFYPPHDQALLDPGRPPDCGGRGYRGSGSLPTGFPGPSGVAAAARFLATRAGRTAFAVIDSEGRLSGVHLHWTFVSASVVKAMLLVAYLRRLDALGQRTVDSSSNSFLYPMINVSDNAAATRTWSIVGDSGLYSVAHAAGMSDFSISGIWANAQISAADQARFFFEMDSLIPSEFDGYARRLLSTIAAYESWGIPAAARPQGYAVFFKGGWRSTGLGQLVHQVARLERPGRTFALAVMTDGDPSMGYGIDTIQGVTTALLR